MGSVTVGDPVAPIVSQHLTVRRTAGGADCLLSAGLRAAAVSCFAGLCTAGTFVPMVGAVGLPFRAKVVGMQGSNRHMEPVPDGIVDGDLITLHGNSFYLVGDLFDGRKVRIRVGALIFFHRIGIFLAAYLPFVCFNAVRIIVQGDLGGGIAAGVGQVAPDHNLGQLHILAISTVAVVIIKGS